MLGLVALVSTTKQVPLAETAKVAAALQKQVSRDLAQIWGLQGCIAAFASLKDMPIGYWPMLVTDDIPDPSAIGACASSPTGARPIIAAWLISAPPN
jgi:hypothetical protein